MRIPFTKERRKTIDELEDEKERATIEEEILTKKAESAEREAVISELKKKYGKGWTRLLGTNNRATLETLRGFLKNAKQGMEGQARRGTDTPVSRMCSFQGVKKA